MDAYFTLLPASSTNRYHSKSNKRHSDRTSRDTITRTSSSSSSTIQPAQSSTSISTTSSSSSNNNNVLRARAFTDLSLHETNNSTCSSSTSLLGNNNNNNKHNNNHLRKPIKSRHSYTHFERTRRSHAAHQQRDGLDQEKERPHPDRMSSTISQGLAPFYSRSRQHSKTQTADGASLRSVSGQTSHSPSSSTRKHLLLPHHRHNGLTRTKTDTTSGNSSINLSSNEASTEASNTEHKNLFVMKHGRRYLKDPSNPYPLPFDLAEWHRQTLRTMLLSQLIGSPILCPSFNVTPPKDVLEVGCGTAFWSSLCHQHFARLGHSVSFTGIDITNTAPNLGKDGSMKWTFVQSNILSDPYPFPDESFDLIMSKDMSLAIPQTNQSPLEEYFRLLRPGGTLEIWENDHLLRTLVDPRQQLPEGEVGETQVESPEEIRARLTGTYCISNSTAFASAQNEYLADYNAWMTTAMQARELALMPCTNVSYHLMSEGEQIKEKGHLRLAIPLGEIRWEREGEGIANVGSDKEQSSTKEKGTKRILTPLQAAVRQTALATFLQSITSLEPQLRAASGKNQDEWDKWTSEMTESLVHQNGSGWGECLEFGAWWAVKRTSDDRIKVVKKPSLTTTLSAKGRIGSSGQSKSPNTPLPARRLDFMSAALLM